MPPDTPLVVKVHRYSEEQADQNLMLNEYLTLSELEHPGIAKAGCFF